jgi:hypothetical protein
MLGDWMYYTNRELPYRCAWDHLIDTDHDTVPDCLEGGDRISVWDFFAKDILNTDQDRYPDYQDIDSDNDCVRDYDEPWIKSKQASYLIHTTGWYQSGVLMMIQHDLHDITVSGDVFLLSGAITGHMVNGTLLSTSYGESNLNENTIIWLSELFKTYQWQRAWLLFPHPYQLTLANHDNDAYPNLRDMDDDGDQILTLIENQWCLWYDDQGYPLWRWYHDMDGDGIPNFLDDDSDDDGILDRDEWWQHNVARDSDSDGIWDFLDADDNNDGILTRLQINTDTDGDGVPDYLDPSQTINNTKDTDGDGIPDYIECPDTKACKDTDGDGIPDYKDTDSDNDSVPDSIEKWPNGNFPQDTDGDGVPDYRDTDDDNDGIPTQQEDPNGDGNPTNDDTDGDGVPDYLDPSQTINNTKDTDGDGIPDYIECPDTKACKDTDGDGIPDYKDTDSDNDSVPDSIEKWPNGNFPQDTDGDGVPDYRDTDDDNDGIPTQQEDPNGDGNPTNDDTDGDGRPNYLDPDKGSSWWWWGSGGSSWWWWWGSGGSSWWWWWGSGGSSWWWWGSGGGRWCMNLNWGADIPHGTSITVYEKSLSYYPDQCTSGIKTCNNGSRIGSPYSFTACDTVTLNCMWPDGKIYYHNVIATFYKFASIVGQQGDGDDLCPRQTRQCVGGIWYTLNSIASNFTYQYKQCLVVAPD